MCGNVFFTNFDRTIPIATFRKYLFGLIVSAYMLTVIGIPVYLHYCGGELEEINYVVKGSSCCGGTEIDANDSSNGCCEDEGLYIQNKSDFTFKVAGHYDVVKNFHQLFVISLPMINAPLPGLIALRLQSPGFPPPLLQAELVSTSVLRI